MLGNIRDSLECRRLRIRPLVLRHELPSAEHRCTLGQSYASLPLKIFSFILHEKKNKNIVPLRVS